jgi:hypothetical protein
MHPYVCSKGELVTLQIGSTDKAIFNSDGSVTFSMTVLEAAALRNALDAEIAGLREAATARINAQISALKEQLASLGDVVPEPFIMQPSDQEPAPRTLTRADAMRLVQEKRGGRRSADADDEIRW